MAHTSRVQFDNGRVIVDAGLGLASRLTSPAVTTDDVPAANRVRINEHTGSFRTTGGVTTALGTSSVNMATVRNDAAPGSILSTISETGLSGPLQKPEATTA